MTLSRFLRDYVYIPLGGSRVGIWMKVRNTFAIFLISGFWHGANWTFIIWGALNAIYFLPLLLTNNNRKNLGVVAEGKLLPSFKELIAMLTTFGLTVFTWVFFRAENVSHAFSYFRGIFSKTLFSIPVQDLKFLSVGAHIIYVVLLVSFFVLLEWVQRNKDHCLQFNNDNSHRIFRHISYYTIIILITIYGGGNQDFIYFQF